MSSAFSSAWLAGVSPSHLPQSSSGMIAGMRSVIVAISLLGGTVTMT